jgi:hypothetical protein
MQKETATEWLFKQLWEEPKDKFTWNAILSKANEMFEQQTKDAHSHGFCEGTCFGSSPVGYKFISSEEYYNKKYKQD